MEATRRSETPVEAGEISEIRPIAEIARLAGAAEATRAIEPSYSMTDPLEGDALSGSASARQRSEHPCAFESIAFVEGARVLTITWLPPAL
jgi:hypothetical protein